MSTLKARTESEIGLDQSMDCRHIEDGHGCKCGPSQSSTTSASILCPFREQTEATLRALQELALTTKSHLDRLARLVDKQTPTPITAISSHSPEDSSHTLVMTCTSDERWHLCWNAHVATISDCLGARYLAMLIERPNNPFSVLDLVRVANGHSDKPLNLGDAGPIIDGKARSAYRARLQQLTEKIEVAALCGDSERLILLKEEHQALKAELKRSINLSGRPRRAASDSERARSAVQRRIRHAIAKITKQNAELGSHLAATMRTGRDCVYMPARQDTPQGKTSTAHL